MVPLLALCGLAAISSSPALPVAATGKTLRHRYVSIELGAGQYDPVTKFGTKGDGKTVRRCPLAPPSLLLLLRTLWAAAKPPKLAVSHTAVSLP